MVIFAALGTCRVLSDLWGFVFRVAPAAKRGPAHSFVLTNAAGVGRCAIEPGSVDCAAQKGLCAAQGYQAFPQHSLLVSDYRLAQSLFLGVLPFRGRCRVNMPFRANTITVPFFEKGSTHRTPRLSVSTRPSLYWPKALPIVAWSALEIAPPVPQRGPCHFEAAMVL